VFGWAGLVVCVLVMSMAVLSGWWTWLAVTRHRESTATTARVVSLSLSQGVVVASLIKVPDPFRRADETLFARETNLNPAHFRWWFHYERGDPTVTKGSVSGVLIMVPLWVPLLLIAFPTWWYWTGLWVRRADTARCFKCGYSRAGLATDAACPECGRSAASPRSAC
jgi:hypothetical protein